jgi:hypothetical protein
MSEYFQRVAAENRAQQQQEQEWQPPAHRAHVLVAVEEPAVRHMCAAVLEDQGHHNVTAPEDFWGVIAVLRSVLHPLVVVYARDSHPACLVRDDERVAAFEALAADMRQHAYVAMDWRAQPLPPRLRVIEEQLDVEFLPHPLDVDAIVAAVARAAARIAAQARS